MLNGIKDDLAVAEKRLVVVKSVRTALDAMPKEMAAARAQITQQGQAAVLRQDVGSAMDKLITLMYAAGTTMSSASASSVLGTHVGADLDRGTPTGTTAAVSRVSEVVAEAYQAWRSRTSRPAIADQISMVRASAGAEMSRAKAMGDPEAMSDAAMLQDGCTKADGHLADDRKATPGSQAAKVAETMAASTLDTALQVFKLAHCLLRFALALVQVPPCGRTVHEHYLCQILEEDVTKVVCILLQCESCLSQCGLLCRRVCDATHALESTQPRQILSNSQPLCGEMHTFSVKEV